MIYLITAPSPLGGLPCKKDMGVCHNFKGLVSLRVFRLIRSTARAFFMEVPQADPFQSFNECPHCEGEIRGINKEHIDL